MKKVILLSMLLYGSDAFSAAKIAVLEGATTKVTTTGNGIVKKIYCPTIGSCVDYTYTGGGVANQHSSYVTQSVSNATTQNTQIVLITGNPTKGLDWVSSNTEGIKVVNMSFSGPSYDYKTKLRDKGIYVVMSTGNNGKNGFNPDNFNVTDVNGAVKNESVIGVSAGWNPLGTATACKADEESSEIEGRYNFDIRCNANTSDAIANDTLANWGYVALGCISNDNQYGAQCGTSFAAPRVAAAIGEILVKHPGFSPVQLKGALDNSDCSWARGKITNSNGSVVNFNYTPLDANGAIASADSIAEGSLNCGRELLDDDTPPPPPAQPNAPSLWKEYANCNGMNRNWEVTWSSSVSGAIYDVDWKTSWYLVCVIQRFRYR